MTYSCNKCVGWCCTYEIIPVTDADVRRLAKRFSLSEDAARRRFTKRGDERDPFTLRHQNDPLFGKACMFLDTKSRRCTVYEDRPGTCRKFPAQSRCGYYEFLKFERANQGDPEFVATT